MKVWSDRGSTCTFRNARSALRNLHVDPLSLHTFMRNKQVEFNPYIYTLTTLYIYCTVLATKYPFFNTKHPVIILRVSLFAVTPSHVASTKIECQIFSYVYRSRKHWECKYKYIYSYSYSSLMYTCLWLYDTDINALIYDSYCADCATSTIGKTVNTSTEHESLKSDECLTM